MRLTELNPRWVGTGTIITGITFDCPHCRAQRLGVTFKNAIDPEGWLAKGVTRHHAASEWNRVGETFEKLTLTPSIDTTRPDPNSRVDFQGHWHGYIVHGEVTG